MQYIWYKIDLALSNLLLFECSGSGDDMDISPDVSPPPVLDSTTNGSSSIQRSKFPDKGGSHQPSSAGDQSSMWGQGKLWASRRSSSPSLLSCSFLPLSWCIVTSFTIKA